MIDRELLHISISAEDKESLRRFAETLNTNMSNVVNIAIKKLIESNIEHLSSAIFDVRSSPEFVKMKAKSEIKESFPKVGQVDAVQIAAYLGIGRSTWWLYVKECRVRPPVKLGKRKSVWYAEYIRLIGAKGIPEKSVEGKP